MDDETGNVNLVRFKIFEQAVLVGLIARNTVVTDQREGENEDLFAVGRIWALVAKW